MADQPQETAKLARESAGAPGHGGREAADGRREAAPGKRPPLARASGALAPSGGDGAEPAGTERPLGPAEAAPHWQPFYRAVSDAVAGLRSRGGRE